MDNVTIVSFKFKHLSLLQEMLESQESKHKNITMKELPKIGFIAIMGQQPIAAGFLRRVEGDIVAQIDSLCSNAHFGSIIRHAGLTKVLDSLISEAKHLKIKGIYAHTLDYSIIRRAEDMGFHKVEQSIIALPIGD